MEPGQPVNKKCEESTRFFEKKRGKKLLLWGTGDLENARVNVAKVFGAKFFKKAHSYFV